VVLSVSVIAGYQLLMNKLYPRQQIEQTSLPIESKQGETVKHELIKQSEAIIPLDEERTVIKTDKYSITLSNVGGCIAEIKLNEFREKGEPLILTKSDFINDRIFSLTGLDDLSGAKFQLEKTDLTLVYTHKINEKLEIIKKYSFYKDKYGIDLEIFFNNLQSKPLKISYDIVGASDIEVSSKFDARYLSSSAKINDKIEQLRVPGLINKWTTDPIAIELNGKPFVPLLDIQKNVRHLLDPEKKVIFQSYEYNSFGEESTNIEEPFNPWRYSCKRLDPEMNLIYFGKRYYDPNEGRWISCDPAGTINSMNLYAFLLNNPFRYTDPDGRFAFPLVLTLAIPLGGPVLWGALLVGTAASFAIGYAIHESAKKIDMPIAEVGLGVLGAVLSEAAADATSETKKEEKKEEKRHTPDQESLSDLVKGAGKEGVTNADADTLLEWANEYNFPARDDRGKPHWESGEHIHLGPKHVPISD
ncbi:MAG: YidC/Oxa1 family insertase periplasmic-domain containing protein, partial [Chlamydiota bacterium]